MNNKKTSLKLWVKPNLTETQEYIWESENPGSYDIEESGVSAHTSPYGIKCNGCGEIHGFVTSHEVTKRNIIVKAVMQHFLVIKWRRGKFCNCVEEEQ